MIPIQSLRIQIGYSIFGASIFQTHSSLHYADHQVSQISNVDLSSQGSAVLALSSTIFRTTIVDDGTRVSTEIELLSRHVLITGNDCTHNQPCYLQKTRRLLHSFLSIELTFFWVRKIANLMMTKSHSFLLSQNESKQFVTVVERKVVIAIVRNTSTENLLATNFYFRFSGPNRTLVTFWQKSMLINLSRWIPQSTTPLSHTTTIIIFFRSMALSIRRLLSVTKVVCDDRWWWCWQCLLDMKMDEWSDVWDTDRDEWQQGWLILDDTGQSWSPSSALSVARNWNSYQTVTRIYLLLH